MKEKKADRTKLLTAGVVALLIIFFIGGIIIGLNNVLAMEGAYPPAKNEEGITPAPKTAQEALDYLNSSLDKAKEGKPRIKIGASFDLDEDTIDTDGSDQLLAGMHFVRDGFDDHLESLFKKSDDDEKPDADFFEDCDALLRYPGIDASDIKDFKCDYTFYKCVSCGEKYEEPSETCEKCGNEEPPVLTYADGYSIDLEFADSEKVLNACFEPRSKEECVEIAEKALGDMAEIDELNIDYTSFRIHYAVDRLTNEITDLEYVKVMDVDGKASFTGDWSRFRGGSFTFTLTEDYTYDFTWPALKLSDSEMTVEPRGSENVLATLICDDPTAYEVKWESSDESLVTVDDEGYFKAGKETGEAVIKASFEYGGNTYSDECVIKVRHPVEGLKMKPKKVTLSVGSEKQLDVKVSPKKATVKTLIWYTKNAEIATVDADGVVKAVSPGKVTVYCLSEDGYFKSTCEVTVK